MLLLVNGVSEQLNLTLVGKKRDELARYILCKCTFWLIANAIGLLPEIAVPMFRSITY